MGRRLMASLDTVRSLRGMYRSKKGFDVHNTSAHSEASSFPDQVKSAWFCLSKGFFDVIPNRATVACYPLNNNGETVGSVRKGLVN